MSGTILRRRDRTARPPRLEHYSSAEPVFRKKIAQHIGPMQSSRPVELPDRQTPGGLVVRRAIQLVPLFVPTTAVILWYIFIAGAENVSRASRILPSRDAAVLIGLHEQNIPNPARDGIEVAAVTAATSIRSHRGEPPKHVMQGTTARQICDGIVAGAATTGHSVRSLVVEGPDQVGPVRQGCHRSVPQRALLQSPAGW